jgi:hypothetical protein
MKQKIKSYYEEFATFDIETTSYVIDDKHKFGFMYHWQMCVGGIVITGRTWQEWIDSGEAFARIYTRDGLVGFYVDTLYYDKTRKQPVAVSDYIVSQTYYYFDSGA